MLGEQKEAFAHLLLTAATRSATLSGLENTKGHRGHGACRGGAVMRWTSFRTTIACVVLTLVGLVVGGLLLTRGEESPPTTAVTAISQPGCDMPSSSLVPFL